MKKNSWLLLAILAVLGIALWLVFPLQSPRLGRSGIRLGLDMQGGLHLVYQADLSSVAPAEVSSTMKGVMAIIETRVNPLGVSEPLIQIQGQDRIIVELPGRNITDVEKERLGRTALLEFRKQVDIKDDKGNVTGQEWVPAKGLLNDQQQVLNSSYFKANTYVTTNSLGKVLLIFEWNSDGAILSKEITTELLNKPLGIFEGSGTDAQPLLGDNGQPIAPIVNAVITDKGEITGLSSKEAQTLSAQLNAGRLPVPLTIVSEQTVTPALGTDFVTKSILAGIIGLAVVMIFMVAYYRVLGLIASLALVCYAVLVLAVFKMLGVTLSVASFGGFVLSLGMAVDANVLIFERMKEEIRAGRALSAAIEAGFNRAWPAIFDSNATTLMAAIILFWLGSTVASSAAVKGFALTLSIGVLASMFTAITVSRAFLRPLSGTSLAQHLSLFTPYQGKVNTSPSGKPVGAINIVDNRLWYFIGSGVVILAGLIGIGVFGLKPGIEFKSGSLLTVSFEKQVDVTQVQAAVTALGYNNVTVQGINGGDFLIHLPVLTGIQQTTLKTGLTDHLGTVQIISSDIVSPAIATETTRNTIIAVVVAAIGMLLYISWAFRRMPNPFRWGTCAILALVHDILVVVGVFAILAGILGWQLDLMFVTGVLTIVGYSVNDTVIIYDRMRENMKVSGIADFGIVTNNSLVETMARSMNTSLTTILTVVVLLLFVGGPIRNFGVVMLVGITTGTYSSIFTAAPLLVVWDKRQWGHIGRKSAA
jgi:preprotein translocase subunit SecD